MPIPSETDSALARRAYAASRWIAIAAIAIGTAVLAGWVLRLRGLPSINRTFGAMGAPAAECFVLAGAALLLARRPPSDTRAKAVASVLAAIVAIVALLTLGDAYAWGIGIERFTPDAMSRIFPGRMPVATAEVFLCFGLALLWLDTEIRGWRISELVVVVALLIALLALIGFIFSFTTVVGTGHPRTLAFHTIGLMLVFGGGILGARPHRGLMRLASGPGAAGVMVRRLIPAAVLIPIVTGSLVIVGQRLGLYVPALVMPYYAMLLIGAFGALILATAGTAKRIDDDRVAAVREVRELNLGLERRVSERTEQLEAANKELEAFSYTVSHDLRAPLRHINGFSEMLAERYGGRFDDDGRRYLGVIRDGAARMGRMIDDLLNMARIDRARMSKQTVDLNALVQESVRDLQPEIGSRDIEWHIHALPSVECDRGLMKLVFANLIGNAVKYTRHREHAAIDIAAAQTSAEVTVSIADNGAGFDQQFEAKLFGVFQRLHRMEEFEGTGVGLATVKRIIAKHGGRVWADGFVDKGATFYFTLPVG